MILAKTQYKIYDNELLAIVDISKIYEHHLESCKYKVVILTDQNNFYFFKDMKRLNLHQICWAQVLSRYNFQTD